MLLKMNWFPNYTCMACGCEIKHSDNIYLCSRCMQNLPVVTQNLDGHYAPFYYAEPINKMILKLKYGDNGFIAKALAPYLAAIYIKYIQQPNIKYLIIPVPLHRSRQRERGYNQSLVLAKELASYLDLPIVTDVLRRVRKTKIQKHMDAATRAANMNDAFQINAVNAAQIKGQNVLLLDDVYTTGATTKACVATLLKSGVHDVKILTIATVADD